MLSCGGGGFGGATGIGFSTLGAAALGRGVGLSIFSTISTFSSFFGAITFFGASFLAAGAFFGASFFTGLGAAFLATTFFAGAFLTFTEAGFLLLAFATGFALAGDFFAALADDFLFLAIMRTPFNKDA